MHKGLWNFEIKTDNLISIRRPDQVIINNNKNERQPCQIVDFVGSFDHSVKLKESFKKRDKYVEFAREPKQVIEHESDGDTSYYYLANFTR